MYDITLGTRESLDMNFSSLNLDQTVSFISRKFMFSSLEQFV